MIKKILILLFLSFSSCDGTFELQLYSPFISYSDFSESTSTVIVRGSGFSLTFNENFLLVSSYLIPASSYAIVDGEEELEFDIPSALPLGSYSAQLLVEDEVSNTFNLIID